MNWRLGYGAGLVLWVSLVVRRSHDVMQMRTSVGVVVRVSGWEIGRNQVVRGVPPASLAKSLLSPCWWLFAWLGQVFVVVGAPLTLELSGVGFFSCSVFWLASFLFPGSLLTTGHTSYNNSIGANDIVGGNLFVTHSPVPFRSVPPDKQATNPSKSKQDEDPSPRFDGGLGLHCHLRCGGSV